MLFLPPTHLSIWLWVLIGLQFCGMAGWVIWAVWGQGGALPSGEAWAAWWEQDMGRLFRVCRRWLVLLLLCFLAVMPLAEIRRRGFLELLLTTPLPGWALMEGHRQFVLRVAGTPILVSYALEAAWGGIGFVAGLMTGMGSAGGPAVARWLVGTVGMDAVALVITALPVLMWGPWFALQSTRPMTALMQTVSVCVVFPSLLCCVAWPVSLGLAFWGSQQIRGAALHRLLHAVPRA